MDLRSEANEVSARGDRCVASQEKGGHNMNAGSLDGLFFRAMVDWLSSGHGHLLTSALPGCAAPLYVSLLASLRFPPVMQA